MIHADEGENGIPDVAEDSPPEPYPQDSGVNGADCRYNRCRNGHVPDATRSTDKLHRPSRRVPSGRSL